MDIVEVLTGYLLDYGLRILGAVAIFLIGRWVARILVNWLKKALNGVKVDMTLTNFFGNVVFYLLFFVILIASLNVLGIPTTSVVAILGAATLAIGLALQDSLGNLAAGVMIILLRPYKVGDWVKINDAEGFVDDIQIFHTRIRNNNQIYIYIPNNDVIDGNIINYSTEALVRLNLDYGIGYGDDILKAKQVLLDIVKADARVVAEPVPDVIVSSLGDSSVNLTVRPYVDVHDIPGVTAATTEQVKLRFDAEGISIPFPQRDVHLFQAN